MKKTLIIGITGADGTGKTTLAKMIAKHYDGTHHSVHASLSKQFRKLSAEVPKDRSTFADFANSLRFESQDPAIAVRGILETVLKETSCGLHVIESFALAAEIAAVEEFCTAIDASFLLFGIDAPIDYRYDWTNKSKKFSKLAVPNGQVMYAMESRDWFDAKEWQPNIEACLKLVPEPQLFYNDGEGIGFVRKVLAINAMPIIDLALAAPH